MEKEKAKLIPFFFFVQYFQNNKKNKGGRDYVFSKDSISAKEFEEKMLIICFSQKVDVYKYWVLMQTSTIILFLSNNLEVWTSGELRVSEFKSALMWK